jgi:hypothetical protein
MPKDIFVDRSLGATFGVGYQKIAYKEHDKAGNYYFKVSHSLFPKRKTKSQAS